MRHGNFVRSRGLRALYWRLSLFFFLAATACVEDAGQEARGEPQVFSGDYAFVDATVIPVSSDGPLEHQTVVIKDGVITAVRAAEETSLADGVKIIKANGKFLAPGLTDMHVHMWNENLPRLYVSYGVTTIRNMWGEQVTLNMRERIRSGELVGPTMFTAGRIIDGPPKIWPTSEEVSTPEEAADAVQSQVEAGYDFIKIYSNLSQTAFDAVAQESRKLGVPFAGHVPEAVPLKYAVEAGMASMEHLYGLNEAVITDGINMGEGRRTPEKVQVASKLLSGELSVDRVIDTEKMQATAETLADSDTWITPTLIVQQQLYLTREQARSEFQRPQMTEVDPMFRDFWNPDNDFRRQERSDEELKALQGLMKVSFEQVRVLNRAGVKILAGSDAPNPFVFHGLSLHEELELLVRAGLTPLEAIRAATLNPARYFGEAGEWGEVTEGARADLVLVRGDPMKDVKNYLKIDGVMLRGAWHDGAELQEMRAKTSAVFEREAAQMAEQEASDNEQSGGSLPYDE